MDNILKGLLVATALTAASPAMSKTTIDVYSRYSTTANVGRAIGEIIRQLNSAQTEYDFRLVQELGGGGEVADQRAIAGARAGSDVLIYGSSSSYAFNRYLIGNTFDREKDLIPIIGVSNGYFGLQVNPESNHKTIEDLISYIRSKPVAYHGSTVSTSTSRFFDEVFRRHYKLDNVKQIVYNKTADLQRAMLVGEIDYTVYNFEDIIGQRVLAVTNNKRNEKYPNAPTGIELGMNDFRFVTQSIISVPKEKKELGEKLKPLLHQICKSDAVKAVYQNTSYVVNCSEETDIKIKITDELQLIEKYKDFLAADQATKANK